MLDGKPLPSTVCVRVWEKGEGGRVVQSLVHGLLLPEDVHTFEDGTNESLGRRLQWHTVAVILNPFFFSSVLVCLNLFMSIFVFVFIAVGLLGCSTDPHPRWAGEGACRGCQAREDPKGCGEGCEQGESEKGRDC